MQFNHVKDAWARRLTALHFYHGPTFANDTAKWITVEDCRALAPVSVITGGRRYPYCVQGQLVLVQRFGWRPQTLLRTGLPLACLAFLGLSLADSYVTLVLAMTAFGFGMGLAGPGYAGGTTLRVGPQEQGSIAGLVAAAPGLGFVIGPLLGAWLYAASPHWPYLAAAVVYLLLAVWVWRQKNA